MKKRYAKYKIMELIDKLKNAGIPIAVNYNMNIGNGLCPLIFDNGDNKNINIGLKELKYPIGNISSVDFTKIIISIFHESRHYYQQTELYKKPEYKEDLYNLIACIGAYEGYYNPNNIAYNYYHNPREIDAEYSGIIEGYKYLYNIFNSEEAKELILKYVNYKVENFNYFIKSESKIQTLEDIENAFKKAFNMSKVLPRKYNYNYKDSDKVISDLISKNIDFIYEFNNISNPIEQDKLLAEVYIDSLKENINKYNILIEKYPIISNTEIDEEMEM